MFSNHVLHQETSEIASTRLPTHKRPSPVPGSIILDKYELFELLGEGGFGKTYRATDVKTGEEWAVKVLEPPATTEYNNIRNEFRISEMAAGHHNVVASKEYYEEDQFCYIVMELVKGQTLYDANEKGVFEDNDELIKHVFLQILDAVEYLHSKGIYHKDLKSQNILLTEDWTVKLIDFGLATMKLYDESMRGTEYYLPPEVYLFNTCNSVAADIWALGQILMEMTASNYLIWVKATMEDEEFQDYLSNSREGNFLYFHENLPLSSTVSEVLFMALHPDPESRISIPLLRRMISDADSIRIDELALDRSPLCHRAKRIYSRHAHTDNCLPSAWQRIDDSSQMLLNWTVANRTL